MTGRESVFSDPEMIRLVADRFVPVADDVTALQVSEDEVGRFFHHVAVQGRMRGRSRPGVSHQGIYAFTADGTSLASGNPLQADRALELLQTAIAAWAERAGGAAADGRASFPVPPRDVGYPDPGGAVLRMAARDLPRPEGLPAGLERFATQWNHDFVWLRPEDTRALVPDALEVGAERQVPKPLLERVARSHLRDIVRGEPRPWRAGAMQRGRLASTIAACDGARVTLALEGEVLLREHVEFPDAHDPVEWAFYNELDATMQGEAVWDVAEGRFERFDLLVVGQRAGAHRYNVRTADPGPSPIGFAFELAGDEPWERTPPHVLRTWARAGESTPTVATTVTGEPYYG